MRRLLSVVPVLLLASFAVPCLKATAAPPTKTAATKTSNQRITLYSDGEVVAVLMFYRANSKKPPIVIEADKAELNQTATANTIRLKGNVSIKRESMKEGEQGITLTADEAFIEILPDRPLPNNF